MLERKISRSHIQETLFTGVSIVFIVRATCHLSFTWTGIHCSGQFKKSTSRNIYTSCL